MCHPGIPQERRRKTANVSVRIVTGLAEIRTDTLKYKSEALYELN
jgi:hypothetical protein